MSGEYQITEEDSSYSVEEFDLPMIVIKYIATQFVFKFKMSSAFEITIVDGDGTITSYDGLDSTQITHTTAYSTPGSYTFQITKNFERISFLDLRFMEHASGSAVNFWPPADCTEFRIYGCSFYGDASGWRFNPAMTVFLVGNNGAQNKGDGLSGDISNWDLPFTTITEFRIKNNSFSGDPSDWVFDNILISRVECDNNALSGSMPNIAFRNSAALHYSMNGNYFTGANIDTFRPAMTRFEINDQRAAFPTVTLDSLLEDIADYFQTNAPSADCVFDFRGINMGIPTGGATNVDKVRIEGYYTDEGKTAWVYVNESDPAFDNGKLVLTFDGNMTSIYTVGYPVFVAKSVQCTIYSWSDGVGTSGMYSWANMVTMDTGGMDMQGHAQTHTDITDLTEQELIDELEAVDAAFVANGLTAPDHIAYPFGERDSETDAIVDGYRLSGRIYSIDLPRPFEYKNAIKYFLKCYWIDDRADRDFDLAAFKSTMDEAMTNKAALISISHNINSLNTFKYGFVKQSDLEAIIDYADEIGMDIITLSEFYNLL
jgi:peptidoglycan/xylan/chitin deacetylase (PgdA/CDA1 family)